MSESSTISDFGAVPTLTDREGLAARYMVGLRTIHAWHAQGILHGKRRGLRLHYDVQESDRRLLAYKTQRESL
jgi:hypothetical protein